MKSCPKLLKKIMTPIVKADMGKSTQVEKKQAQAEKEKTTLLSLQKDALL